MYLNSNAATLSPTLPPYLSGFQTFVAVYSG